MAKIFQELTVLMFMVLKFFWLLLGKSLSHKSLQVGKKYWGVHVCMELNVFLQQPVLDTIRDKMLD